MEPRRHIPASILQALVIWMVYVLVFVTFGGIGAGVTALLWELVMPEPFSDLLYAVIFAGYGLIAYRLAQRLVEQRKLS